MRFARRRALHRREGDFSVGRRAPGQPRAHFIATSSPSGAARSRSVNLVMFSIERDDRHWRKVARELREKWPRDTNTRARALTGRGQARTPQSALSVPPASFILAAAWHAARTLRICMHPVPFHTGARASPRHGGSASRIPRCLSDRLMELWLLYRCASRDKARPFGLHTAFWLVLQRRGRRARHVAFIVVAPSPRSLDDRA